MTQREAYLVPNEQRGSDLGAKLFVDSVDSKYEAHE